MTWKLAVASGLFASCLVALPPSDTQCAGYAYTRGFFLYRDGSTMRADPYIGGLNGVSPCGFWVLAEIRSPSGRLARGEDEAGGSFSSHFANVTVILNVGTDTGNYNATVQWRVEDDTVNPFQYYTPAPRSGWKATCSATGDERERLITEYPAYNVTPTPNCSDFTQQSGSQYFTFQQLTGGGYAWAILRNDLFTGVDATRTNYGQAQTINSGYRSPFHNASVGGSSTSRHMFGDAADVDNPNEDLTTCLQICQAGRGANGFIEPRSMSGLRYVHIQWHYHEGWDRCQ
jgi:hypothetical protein